MSAQRPYSVIIVAIDEAARAEQALAPARDLARAFGSTLLLIRRAHGDIAPEPDPAINVGDVTLANRASDVELRRMSHTPHPSLNAGALHPTTSADTGPVAGELPHHIRNAEDTAATGELNILSNRLRDEGFLVEEAEAVEDLAATAVAEARNRSASLIVLAAKRQGGLERLFFGDTADKILRQANCPVLVVPAGAS